VRDPPLFLGSPSGDRVAGVTHPTGWGREYILCYIGAISIARPDKYNCPQNLKIWFPEPPLGTERRGD
ncbi:hypothetical protein, partial [Phormidium sp. CCY1219]|uniref:hypothetical protein n=1 Tax=Phormidium sp. CCY1219 TaxID=2886104 RepID=UPI002D1F15A2